MTDVGINQTPRTTIKQIDIGVDHVNHIVHKKALSNLPSNEDVTQINVIEPSTNVITRRKVIIC